MLNEQINGTKNICEIIVSFKTSSINQDEKRICLEYIYPYKGALLICM